MKKIIIITILFLFASVYGTTFAQAEDEWLYPHLLSNSILKYCGKRATPPKIKGVVVDSQVVFDRAKGVYSYEYSLSNGKQSTGCLWIFEIDITRPEGTVELSESGLEDYPRYVHKQSPTYPDIPPMIPVAFPDLPRRNLPQVGEVTIWGAGTTVYGAASWGVALEQLVPPGEGVSGFIMTSHGIPAIRDFKTKPDYVAKDEDIYNMGVTEDELIEESWKHLNAFYESIAFKGKTIGPTAPPEELVPADFLQSIIDMKHEAMELGWVTNEDIKDSLDMKLDAALKKLQSGNTKAAANILGAFINEVEAQGCESYEDCPKGKHLTPEAYALLKFNAQYLMDNLK